MKNSTLKGLLAPLAAVALLSACATPEELAQQAAQEKAANHANMMASIPAGFQQVDAKQLQSTFADRTGIGVSTRSGNPYKVFYSADGTQQGVSGQSYQHSDSGNWTVEVTAREGTEGTVIDLGIGVFAVGVTDVRVTKDVTVISDPVTATPDPKMIPGAVLEYSIAVANHGTTTLDVITLTPSPRLSLISSSGLANFEIEAAAANAFALAWSPPPLLGV